MSEFSTLLSGYIRQKGYSVRALAKRMGVPTATLTKLCNGTRGPDNQVDNVRRISDLLMLTPAQQDILNAALEKEILGVERYTSRMEIKNLLESMKRSEVPLRHTAANIRLMGHTFADKRNDVYAILREFFENAAAGHSLDVATASDDPVMLEGLCRIAGTTQVRLRHIIPMIASDGRNDTANAHNIDAIGKILPVLLGSGGGGGYQPVYYYERGSVIGSNALHLPNVLISDQGVLRCSADYSRCAYIDDASEQRFYRKLFMQQFTACRPVVTACEDFHSQILRYEQMMEAGNQSERALSLSWQPCLMWAVTPQEVEHFMSHKVAFRNDYLEVYLAYLRKMATRKKLALYFSQEGLYEFAATGRLREIPETFVDGPLPMSYRRTLLERMLAATESGVLCPRIIREEKLRVGQDAQLIGYGADTVIVSILNHNHVNSVFFIEEFSTNWSALDFLENIEATDCLYTLEQSCQIIRDMVETCLSGDGGE